MEVPVRVQPDAMALVVHGTLAVRWPVVPVRNELACIGKHHVRIRFVAYRLAVLWNICVVRMVLAADLPVCGWSGQVLRTSLGLRIVSLWLV